jgi:hypothetical protein
MVSMLTVAVALMVMSSEAGARATGTPVAPRPSLSEALERAAREASIDRSEPQVPKRDKLGRVSPAVGGPMKIVVLGLLSGTGNIALGLTQVAIRRNGTCRDVNPAYERPCGGKWDIGLQIASGALALMQTATLWPRGSSVPRVVGDHVDGRTTIEYRNQTNHTLTIVLKGPQSYTRTIAAHAREVIVLQPGRYEEGVESSNGALPFRALQTYASGKAYMESYFIAPGR